jgi:hypothetical protein
MNATLERIRDKWWPYWFVIDAIGFFGGLVGCAAYVYVVRADILIWKGCENLWPNLTASILVVWLAVRVIDKLLTQHEARRWKAFHDLATVRAAELVVDCIDIFEFCRSDEREQVYVIGFWKVFDLPDLTTLTGEKVLTQLMVSGEVAPQKAEQMMVRLRALAGDAELLSTQLPPLLDPVATKAVVEFAMSIRRGVNQFAVNQQGDPMRFLSFMSLSLSLPALAKWIDCCKTDKLTSKQFYDSIVQQGPPPLAAVPPAQLPT